MRLTSLGSRLALVALLCAAWFPAALCSADRDFPLFVIEADPIFTVRSQGLLAELHHRVMQLAGLSPHAEIMPARRASRRFERDPTAGLFPAVHGACYAQPHLESLPLIVSRRLLITRREDGVARDLTALRGKRLGLIRGFQYDLDARLLRQLTLEEVSNLASLYRMLIQSRIDAFIVDPLFLQSQAQQLGIDLQRLSYDIRHPVDRGAIVYSFHDTPASRQRLWRINDAIRQLHASPQTSGLPEPLLYLLPSREYSTLAPSCAMSGADYTELP